MLWRGGGYCLMVHQPGARDKDVERTLLSLDLRNDAVKVVEV